MHDQAKQTKNHGKKNSKCRFCTSVIAKKIALALPILKALLKNKPVINIPANLQAYFNNRRYFPILMPKFDPDTYLYLSSLFKLRKFFSISGQQKLGSTSYH